ncbi:RNA 3'-terminal phosphate cyclase domain-containing protein [Irpex rosettiformis]|uniref:RNA 3'-terminal phosphate cyclase domain-containing protein n=1 Tax=Irpex rosettiformis TaxID=378272 RepID=A0ACB8TTL8_9APHY|nr:RNA 3'-terminal phosphate cyclase domain-containing protein [Irpex rosettiformis]
MLSAAAGHLLINAAGLSSGAQVVRNAVALSALMSKPISLINHRKKKRNSGLTHQNIADVNLVKDICSAKTTDCHLRSFKMDFAPSRIQTPGRYLSDTGFITSPSLSIQAALPCLSFSQEPGPSKLFLVGRTNGRRETQIDYTKHVLFPFLHRRFGLDHKLDIVRRGYPEQGGGIVNVDVAHTPGPLPSVNLLERGAVTSIKGRAYVYGEDAQLADRIRSAATSTLIMADVNPEIIDITPVLERAPANTPDAHKASGLVLWAETRNGCVLGSSSQGIHPPDPRIIGRNAAKVLLRNMGHEGCVDEYLQDQMIVFLALAKGTSCIRTGPLTDDTRAAIAIAEQLTGAKFQVMADGSNPSSLMISCEGIGYTADYVPS